MNVLSPAQFRPAGIERERTDANEPREKWID